MQKKRRVYSEWAENAGAAISPGLSYANRGPLARRAAGPVQPCFLLLTLAQLCIINYGLLEERLPQALYI